MWVLRGFLLQLYTEYKLLSNLGLDGVGRPFLILNGRDQPLRLRSHWEAVVGLPSCAPGRGTGWEQAPRGMLLLLASSSPLTQLEAQGGSYRARVPWVHIRITWRAFSCLGQYLPAEQLNQILWGGTRSCGCQLLRACRQA